MYNSAVSSASWFRELEIDYSITGLSPAKIYEEHFALFHYRGHLGHSVGKKFTFVFLTRRLLKEQ